MKNICVVTIKVNDMNQARDFYVNKLGFTIKKEYCPEIIQIQNDGVTLVIEESKNKTEINYPNDAQTLIAFRTSDLQKDIEELKSKKIELVFDSPRECPVGKYIAFKDPAGNVHELLEFFS